MYYVLFIKMKKKKMFVNLFLVYYSENQRGV